MTEPTTRTSQAHKTTTRPVLAVYLAMLLVLLTLPACAGTGSQGVKRSYLGTARLEPVRQPTKGVEAFRVSRTRVSLGPGQRHIAGYPITAGAFKVPPSLTRELQQLLNRQGSYRDPNTDCKFAPGVVFRFLGDNAIVDVLICFNCNEIEVHRDEVRLGIERFTDRRARFVEIAKKIFPNDGIIQKLRP